MCYVDYCAHLSQCIHVYSLLPCEHIASLQVDRCHRVIVRVGGWPAHPVLRLRVLTLRCRVALDVDCPPRPAIKVSVPIITFGIPSSAKVVDRGSILAEAKLIALASYLAPGR
jgi:hypothetical protein